MQDLHDKLSKHDKLKEKTTRSRIGRATLRAAFMLREMISPPKKSGEVIATPLSDETPPDLLDVPGTGKHHLETSETPTTVQELLDWQAWEAEFDNPKRPEITPSKRKLYKEALHDPNTLVAPNGQQQEGIASFHPYTDDYVMPTNHRRT